MEYRRLGTAGLKVSEVALGAWLTFGADVDKGTAKACVKAAVDSGINFLDNADAYARGQAEQAVGDVIRDLGLSRKDLVLSSKVFWPMSDGVNDRGLSRKHIMESIEGSLQRLGTDYLDIYFCHRYDPDTPLEEVLRTMDDLVHQGKVLYWGTSVWSASQIERAVGVAERLNTYAPQVEQPRYNILDRHIELEVMPVCGRLGIGLTVFSPLAQGLLTGKYNAGVPESSRAARGSWLDGELNERNLDAVRQLSVLAGELGLSMPQLALAWILRRPEISSVITGATRAEHVQSNAQATGVHLTTKALERIDKILEGVSTHE
ncbi:MAG: aldo/keto reductase family protein [Anaerolineae bacterium]|nr:aldo/keto reductase family protein [Anaerolineae bacterium]